MTADAIPNPTERVDIRVVVADLDEWGGRASSSGHRSASGGRPSSWFLDLVGTARDRHAGPQHDFGKALDGDAMVVTLRDFVTPAHHGRAGTARPAYGHHRSGITTRT
ncbi:hypothetical protein ADL19_21400 [Streptomyces purpurogeneiscleroticus]|nr:hypothetical protein ADL19_21400 [Streptomyces purpurogeneiscleroticus]